MGNNDDWMDNPIEMDDWIREMDEETKGTQPKGGGSPPGNGGSNNNTSTKRNTTKKSNDEYNASD